MIELPQGPFDVIACDPPWRYNQRFGPGTRFGVGAGGHYSTMSTDEICTLPVREIAAPDCSLFLWATWPLLPDALRVIEAWGFEYLTIGFDWVKTYDSGGLFHGVGYYAKSNTEPCLLTRRGKAMKPAVDDVSSVIVSPRREHSRKPEAVRTRISRMYPTARKVELFCRESAEGWETWGNQVDAVGFARQEKLLFTAPYEAKP
jgi:N6-adenosine-specific RNA methylase IME4